MNQFYFSNKKKDRKNDKNNIDLGYCIIDNNIECNTSNKINSLSDNETNKNKEISDFQKNKLNKKSLDNTNLNEDLIDGFVNIENNFNNIDNIYESTDNDFTIFELQIPSKDNKKLNNNCNIPINKKNIDKNLDNENVDIFDEISVSKTFKKKVYKKDNNDILDFEYIEMPKVEESGGFTEINSPYIKSNKKEEKESNEQNYQNNILFNYFNSRATKIKNNLNTNYFNFFKKDKNKNKNDEDVSNRSCINLGGLAIKKKNYKLIKAMAVLKSSNYQTWKDNFKSLVSSLYYNGYGLSKTFDKESPTFPLYLFDKKITDDNHDEINRSLKSFLYMSYRSGFINLNNIGCGDYTSDCGWGCMLRCSQMILSKGLIQKKILDCFQKEGTIIDYDFIRKETLYLFNDNYLNYKDIERHPDFKNFWKLYKELVDTNPEYNSICEIIPPYSIHILCKLGKCAGEYTSFVKLVKIFSKINTDLFNDINIIFFECGYISKNKLYSYFCEEYTEFDDNYFETDTYNNVDYIFKKGGIVFISFRLGLYNNIDSTYIKVIPKLFEKFNNNLGFVSGKKDRAYYFIGVQNDKLIFVDPHYNQQTTNNSDKDYESYYTENLYLLDYKDLSSELTIGIAIFNMTQFKQFLNDLNWFNKNYKDINLISLD